MPEITAKIIHIENTITVEHIDQCMHLNFL